MLKFIDVNDFSLVEKYKQNDDGSVQWWYQNSNGVIREGFTRTDENENIIDVWATLQAKITANEITLTPDTPEEAQTKATAAFKANRQAQLDSAIVDANGFLFDADEISIGRMASAVLAASGEADTYAMQWSLADTGTGVMTDITLADLRLAHQLAVLNMSAIWSV